MRPVRVFRFLIPSKLEGSEAQLTEKQAVLLMHNIYMKCCTGPLMNKSTAREVGEDFSLSTSTCFYASRPKPVDIQTVCAL